MKEAITHYCRDCGKAFVFSTQSQEYFQKRGWPLPVRCPHCREVHDKRLNGKYAGLGAMLSKLGDTGIRKGYGMYGIWFCSNGFE